MSPLIDFFFGQYHNVAPVDIALELIAVFFGLASVWYAKQNNIAVYPTGMLSTAIFVYLLWKWTLLGDMLIQAYFFVMSVYGWFIWTRQRGGQVLHPIQYTTPKEKGWAMLLFVASLGFVYLVYTFFDRWEDPFAKIDTLTTAIFFVGMWLMAKRKIEHWIFWIVGDIISVQLYFLKGFTVTSLQYLIFTFIAISGYRLWKKERSLAVKK